MEEQSRSRRGGGRRGDARGAKPARRGVDGMGMGMGGEEREQTRNQEEEEEREADAGINGRDARHERRR